MIKQQGLQWRPIEELELLGRHIADLLASTTAQYEALRLSSQESNSVDAYALGRLNARLTVQRDDLWHIDEQLRRWLTQEVTSEQRVEVHRLGEQMVRLYEAIDQTLLLAGELERRGAALQQKKHVATRPAATRKKRATNRAPRTEQE